MDVIWFQWLALDGSLAAEEQRTRLVDYSKALLQEQLVTTTTSMLAETCPPATPRAGLLESVHAPVFVPRPDDVYQTSNKHQNHDDDQYSYPDGLVLHIFVILIMRFSASESDPTQ